MARTKRSVKPLPTIWEASDEGEWENQLTYLPL